MSATTWTVDVDGVRHTISVERDPESRRSMIRVNGRMAARPMTDEETEREVPVGSMRYVIRRMPEDKFELDVPPETFLNPTATKLRSRTHAGPTQPSGGRSIAKIVGGIIALLFVAGLVRIGHQGLAYMRIPWKPYSAADGTFKVNFPADPAKSTETMNINGDIWKFVSLESRHKNHFYNVEYVDAHMVVTEQNAPAVLDRFFDGWMSALSATVLTKEPMSLARNPAISFTSRLPKGSGEEGDKLQVDALQRGVIALRDKRIIVAWTLAAEKDPISWDLTKFLESFEVPPPGPRETGVLALATPPPPQRPPVTETVARASAVPIRERGEIEMATPVARVYAYNRTKKYYPEDCRARPEGAYPIAKSLAIRQGFTLAAECEAAQERGARSGRR